jgi:GntR family transcriptional regulator, transcriptional repressor for pyruvate dehydrogenase complex
MPRTTVKPAKKARRNAPASESQAPGKALKRLRGYITENGLTPGMRLPAERELAELFEVGRPALREAIQALSVLEVLVSRRGSGTYIRSLANLEGGWPANPRLDEVDYDLIELLEVRKMIEPEAAALAAGRATAEQLRDMKDHLVKLAENAHNLAVREQQDYLFHEAIIRAAGNKILRSLVDKLTPMLVKSRRVTGPAHRDMARIIQQHTAIYEAIRLGNAALAEEAMRQHLLGVGLDLISEPKP